MKFRYNNRKVYNVIFELIIVIFMNLNIMIVKYSLRDTANIGLDPSSRIENIISYFVLSLQHINLIIFALSFVSIGFLIKQTKNIKVTNLFVVLNIFCSFLIVIFIVFGISFRKFGDLSVIFYSSASMLKVFCFILGWTYVVYHLILLVIVHLFGITITELTDAKEFGNLSVGKFALFILILWIPYMIVLFPATGNADTWNQLTEFFNHGYLIINDYPIAHYLVKNGNFTITNQHNFFVTLFYGTCVKIGLNLFKNAEIGLFFASFLQMWGLSSVFAYSLRLLGKYFSKKIVCIFFGIFAFFPIFPIFAIFLAKNTIYTIALIWFILLLFELVLDKSKLRSLKWEGSFVASILLQMGSEKFAQYIIVVIFVYTLIQFKDNWKKITLLILLPMVLFKIATSYVLFPLLNVTDGDSIEAYSIPIQQTALYVKKYPNDISKKEYQILNKVFVVKNLAQIYNPQISDPVKSSGGKSKNFIEGYRYQTVTKKEFNAYKSVWLKMFFKHPIIYVTAFFNMNYGYLDLGQVQAKTYSYATADSLPLVLTKSSVFASQKGNKNIETNLKFTDVRLKIAKIYNAFSKIPPTSFILNGNVYLWMTVILFLAVVFYGAYRFIIIFIPLLMQIPIIMLSPVNNDQRYLLPFILSFIVMVILYLILKKKRN